MSLNTAHKNHLLYPQVEVEEMNKIHKNLLQGEK